MIPTCKIIEGDAIKCLKKLPDNYVQTVVTSPPYWNLRDYGHEGQIGLEETPEKYIRKMVRLFKQVHRVLKKDGTCWVNMGDSYAGSWGSQSLKESDLGLSSTITGSRRKGALPAKESMAGSTKHLKGIKPKDLMGMPWMLAFALRKAGWYLRSDIIWFKPNPMPESVKDRPTKAHEYLFLLTKSQKYYFDYKAIQEKSVDCVNNGKVPDGWQTSKGSHSTLTHNATKAFDETSLASWKTRIRQKGEEVRESEFRNKRTVWEIGTFGFKDSHFATFPPDLVKPCILAGSKAGDIVLDPFMGSGTTAMVALELGRNAIGIEINPEYVKLIKKRIDITPGLML